MNAKIDIIQALHETVRANQIEMEHLRRELFIKDEAIEVRDMRIRWLNDRLDQQGNTYEYCLNSSKEREGKLEVRVKQLEADLDKSKESFL